MSNFVARYKESRVTQWKETMIRIEEDKQIQTARTANTKNLNDTVHKPVDEKYTSPYCQETVIPNHLLSRLANCPRDQFGFSNSPIRDSKLKLNCRPFRPT